MKTTIVDVTADNMEEYPQIICFINPKHPSFPLKTEWLKSMYKKGLKTKLLFVEGEKKPVGFIEYIPGEYCWRAVSAAGYMFVHCLWINGNKYKHKGLGSLLLEESENDAKNMDMSGICALASDRSFMASKKLFLKNGYTVASESGKEQLMVKFLKKKAKPPAINDWESELKKHRRLTIFYSRQCPWVARSIEEFRPILEKEFPDARIIQLTTPLRVQKGPSLYGAFSLIHDGRLLADRYISKTRFMNIIEKELR